MIKDNRLTIIRDTMKLFSEYVEITTPKQYYQDCTVNIAKMIFNRLEKLESMEG